MAARLKVFGWSDGFHSWTVATSSRPKALAAWNVEQDLFKSGLAHEVADGPEREAALASPGTIIKTAMAIDPGSIEVIKPDPDQTRRRKAKARVAEIQARIDALDAQVNEQVQTLSAERDALDQRIKDLQADADRKRRALVKSLQATRG